MASTVFAIEAGAPATSGASVSAHGWRGSSMSAADAVTRAFYGTTHGTGASFGTCKQLVPAPRVIVRDRMGPDAWRDPV